MKNFYTPGNLYVVKTTFENMPGWVVYDKNYTNFLGRLSSGNICLLLKDSSINPVRVQIFSKFGIGIIHRNALHKKL